MPNLTLSGGINNIQHPGNLPPNVQVSIKNISFDATGKLSILKELEAYGYLQAEGLSDLIFEQDHIVKRIYQWTPSYLPSDAYNEDTYNDVIVVFYADHADSDIGKVKVVYRKNTDGDAYKSLTLTTDAITVNDVVAVGDSWQMIFVDGRTQHRARRITINQNGVISVSYLGMSAIYLQAVVKTVLYTSEDDYGTGIGQGCAFGYRYSFRNEYGESSPVSPLTVFDLLDYYKRGEYVDDAYVHDSVAHGSLKEIQLEITVPADAVYLDLWRQDADGVENDIGFNAMRLVKSISVKNSNPLVPLTVKDNYPYGVTAVNLLRDDSPKADYVTLSNSAIFFSNACNTPNLPFSVAVMWKIYITNNNPVSYINRYVEFDLFDATVNPGVSTDDHINLAIDDVVPANFRFMDSDLLTPLESYWSDEFDKDSYELTANDAVKVHRLVKVRIPEQLAFSTKIIYFVIAGDSVTTPTISVYPNPLDFGTVYPAVD